MPVLTAGFPRNSLLIKNINLFLHLTLDINMQNPPSAASDSSVNQLTIFTVPTDLHHKIRNFMYFCKCSFISDTQNLPHLTSVTPLIRIHKCLKSIDIISNMAPSVSGFFYTSDYGYVSRTKILSPLLLCPLLILITFLLCPLSTYLMFSLMYKHYFFHIHTALHAGCGIRLLISLIKDSDKLNLKINAKGTAFLFTYNLLTQQNTSRFL